MYLQKVGAHNAFSQTLDKKITDRVEAFGKIVRYKFDISKENPDPTKYNGTTIWPNVYTLDPAVFNVTDTGESGKARDTRKIALIESTNEKGEPSKYRKIRIEARDKGILRLDLTKAEDFDIAKFLELHPKSKNGIFPDPSKHQVFERIDETAFATTQRELRTAKVKALNVAAEMSDADIIQFANAMQWDEGESDIMLRNKVEDLAENDPVYFNDLVAGKNIEYRAVVTKAVMMKLISFDPADWKFTWTSNNQPITMISPVEGKTHIEKFAEWLQIGGEKAVATYKKIKDLVK